MARLFCAAALVCGAQVLPVHAQDGADWKFELPHLDGTHFVSSAALQGPVLVNFWSKSCPPCMAEMPRLRNFVHAHAQWTLVLVTADEPFDAAQVLNRSGPWPVGRTLPLRAGLGLQSLMRSAGNHRGALPFSLVLHQGKQCASHTGEVMEKTLEYWQLMCAPAGER